VSKNTFNAGTDSTAVLHTTMGLVQHCTVVWLKYNTVYVLYGFIPVTVEVTVFTGYGYDYGNRYPRYTRGEPMRQVGGAAPLEAEARTN
jgi:hypothetical protein